jgi:large subunit ribosomal protein L6
MSRIGKKVIEIPAGVDIQIQDQLVTVKGPKGQLQRVVHETMRLEKDGASLHVVPKDPEAKDHGKYHGLVRSLVNNMVVGVSEGYTKNLTLIGVGYRAAVQGNDLQLTLGYSHPVVHAIPTGLQVQVEKQTQVIITGADKELVGQTAANIRAYRKPEPYHGKGVRYSDEQIITKVGKAAGKK